MARLVKDFNKEISLYPIYALHDNGRLERVYEITSVRDYNHFDYELHHFIKFTDYSKNRKWYEDRGIRQKLILMRKKTHQHLENPVYFLDEESFKELYHISKSELLFDKKNYNRKVVLTERYLDEQNACCECCANNFCNVCIAPDSPKEMEEIEPNYRCEKWEIQNA